MLSGCELIDAENISLPSMIEQPQKNKRIIEKKFHYLIYDMLVRAKKLLILTQSHIYTNTKEYKFK
jgi:hypothetical protein